MSKLPASCENAKNTRKYHQNAIEVAERNEKRRDINAFVPCARRYYVSPPINSFVGNRQMMERLQIENDSLARYAQALEHAKAKADAARSPRHLFLAWGFNLVNCFFNN